MSQAQIDGGMRDEMAGNQGSNRLLYSAIENRLLFRFRYRGNERIVEPHDYGIQKGIERLLCWQIGGQSGGPIPGWRLVDVAGMQNCMVLNQEFSGGRGFLANIIDGTMSSFGEQVEGIAVTRDSSIT